MRTSVICIVALLALACVASAQPARKNATATAAGDEPMAMAPKRNATAAAGAVKNATAAAGAKKAGAAGAEPAEPKAAGAEPKAAGAEPKAAEPAKAAEPKKSSASVATTGFAAAVAGSVLLMQLVL